LFWLKGRRPLFHFFRFIFLLDRTSLYMSPSLRFPQVIERIIPPPLPLRQRPRPSPRFPFSPSLDVSAPSAVTSSASKVDRSSGFPFGRSGHIHPPPLSLRRGAVVSSFRGSLPSETRSQNREACPTRCWTAYPISERMSVWLPRTLALEAP